MGLSKRDKQNSMETPKIIKKTKKITGNNSIATKINQNDVAAIQWFNNGIKKGVKIVK